MKKMWMFVIILFLSTTTMPLAEAHVGEYDDSNVPIEINDGQDFTIRLKSNVTTGYKWEVAGQIDEKIIKLTGSEYKAPKLKIVGAGGYENWNFKAVGKGQTEINFQYIRPWEKGVNPTEKKTFIVIVK